MLSGIGIHLLVLEQGVQRGVEADFAAILAGAGAYVHQPVGTEHGLRIVFHHHHGVALVSQSLEGGNELAVILLVQADGRFVQDIEHIHQLGAYLGGQADALAFTTGQRAGRTVQGQVVQAHVQHELHALPQFFEDVAGHVFLPLVEAGGDGVQPLAQFRHFHGGHLGNGFAVHLEAQGFAVQAGALADRAGDGVFNVVQDSAPAFHLRHAAVSHAEEVFRTVDQQAHGLVRQGVDGVVEAEVVFAGDGPDDVELAVLPHLSQGGDGAVGHALAAVRDNGVDVHVHNGSQALAVRAVALRRVEGEAVRLGFLQRKAALRIYQMLGEVGQGIALYIQDGQGAFSNIESPGHGIPDAAVVSRLGLEAVYHYLDEVGLVAVQGLHFLQFQDFSVDAHLGVAAAAQLVQELAVMALSAPDERGQQVALAARIPAHHQVYNLLIRVTHHLLSAFGGEGAGTLGIQQAQEVVDFRDSAHSASGVVARGFLLYGDDGGEAGDFFHLRLFQDAHEVLGIGGEGIHVAALAFGINGVERKRALAAAAEARDHYEFPSGNGYVNVLQVVRPRTPDLDILLLRHRIQRYETYRNRW